MIFTLSTRRAIFAAIVLLPFAVSAQTNAEDPQNPLAATSSAPYKSVFSDYKNYQDPEVQSWRKSNADVGQASMATNTGMENMQEKSSAHTSPSSSALAPHPAPAQGSRQKH